MDMDPTASPGLPGAWTDDAPACSLPTAERPLRQAEFDGLFAATLVEARQPADDHAVLRLAGPTGTSQRTRDLAARETDCCSFFDFTVTAVPSPYGDEVVTLDVRVPMVHTSVLTALVLRAEAVAERRGKA